MKVFIGGSRRIGRLDAEVKRRNDTIVEKRLQVLVGDELGATVQTAASTAENQAMAASPSWWTSMPTGRKWARAFRSSASCVKRKVSFTLFTRREAK